MPSHKCSHNESRVRPRDSPCCGAAASRPAAQFVERARLARTRELQNLAKTVSRARTGGSVWGGGGGGREIVLRLSITTI